MRGIRGATTVAKNDEQRIHEAARELVSEILRCNNLCAEDIGALIFSATEDLTAGFPTAGVRKLEGFDLVPLFDARQTAVEGSLPLCLRVLMLVDTEKKQREIHHVYLNDAANLRPDLAKQSYT